MSHKPIITNRVLSNKVTGIDVFVPDHLETPGKIQNTAVYNVIVITKLFYYKTKQHKESDLVQFMIPKQYEEFEDLYHKLSARFPSVNFPNLPRKSLLASSSVFNERRKVMDSVLRMVARMQKLCCSPMVLQFLGATKPKPSRSTSKSIEDSQPDTPAANTNIPEDEAKSNAIEDGSEAQLEEVDLFMESTPDQPSSSLSTDLTDGDLFSVGSTHQTVSSHKLLYGNDDQLFAPDHAKTPHNTPITGVTDHSDLLDIDDDFEDLLALSKKSKQRSSVKATNGQSGKTRTSSSRSTTDSTNDEMFSRARTPSYKKEHSGIDSLDDIFKTGSQRKSFLTNRNNDTDEDDDALFNQIKTTEQPTDSVVQLDIETHQSRTVTVDDGHIDKEAARVHDSEISHPKEIIDDAVQEQNIDAHASDEDVDAAHGAIETHQSTKDSIIEVEIQHDIEAQQQPEESDDLSQHDTETDELYLTNDIDTTSDEGVVDEDADNIAVAMGVSDGAVDKPMNNDINAAVTVMDSDEIIAYIDKQQIDQMEDLEL